MIHVDIVVPSIDKTYEFTLNENIKLLYVIEEIAYVIAQNEQRSWVGEMGDLLLCNCSSGMVLPRERTLHECHVMDGNELLLI